MFSRDKNGKYINYYILGNWNISFFGPICLYEKKLEGNKISAGPNV